MFKKNEEGNIAVAVSIVVAGIIIAAAVIFTGGNQAQVVDDTTGGDNGGEISAEALVIRDTDNVKGNPDAPITIFEYSDTECPFCIRLHATLDQIVEEYEEVNWVYRHFPLHAKSLPEATAAECAASLGDRDTFWQYLDLIFANTPGNDQLDLNLLPQFAEQLGLDVEVFSSCFNDGDFIAEVRAQGAEAQELGARGTPFSIIVTPEGNTIPVSGAQPIDVWRGALDSIIADELSE